MMMLPWTWRHSDENPTGRDAVSPVMMIPDVVGPRHALDPEDKAHAVDCTSRCDSFRDEIENAEAPFCGLLEFVEFV